MTDKKQIMDNLMEHGKAVGKLTTKEITDALEKLDYDVDQMDNFYDTCASLNIEIIDDIVVDDNLDISNPEEERFMASEDGQTKIAQSICDAFGSFYKKVTGLKIDTLAPIVEEKPAEVKPASEQVKPSETIKPNAEELKPVQLTESKPAASEENKTVQGPR